MLKVNFSSKEEIMTITIEEVIQKIDDWNDKPFECQEMTGGLTNRNYRVDVGGQAQKYCTTYPNTRLWFWNFSKARQCP
jgi:hypothetical protein